MKTLFDEIIDISKKEKIRLFFDMDGVCAEEHSETYEVPLIKENAKDFYFNKRPLKTMINIMKKLSKRKNIELYILSSCEYENQVEQKHRWLKKYIPFIKQENQYFAVCLYIDNIIVGMGRVVGDEAYFEIYDIVVDKDYQGLSLGSIIVKEIAKWYKTIEDDDTFLYTNASKNKEKFYEKFGVVARPNDDVGAVGMKIAPASYFGVVERFSVFAATGFNCALGPHLFFSKNTKNNKNENGNIESLGEK